MDKEHLQREMSETEQAFWGKYAEKLNTFGVLGHNAQRHVRRAQEFVYGLEGLKLNAVSSAYLDSYLDVIDRHEVRLAPQGDSSKAAKTTLQDWQLKQVIHAVRCIEDASAKTLGAAVKENVEKGSRVETDGWSGYTELSHRGFGHERLRSEGVVGEDLLPLCHCQAALLKRWILGTYPGAVSHSHLDYDVDEYTFRFDRRPSRHRGLLFYRLLQNAGNPEGIGLPIINLSRAV